MMRIFYRSVLAASFLALTSTHALAVDTFVWQSGQTGAQSWTTPSNWSPSGVPNSGEDVANISVGASTTIDLGAMDQTVVELMLNTTNPAANVEVSSSGGILVLQNDDDNNIDGSENNPYLGYNLGRVRIHSTGGATNPHTISAMIRDSNTSLTNYEGVAFHGDTSIVLSGGYEAVSEIEGAQAAISSFLTDGAEVTISGPISLTDPVNGMDRDLRVNTYGDNDPGVPPKGTIRLTGDISGSGGLLVGWDQHIDSDVINPSPAPTLPSSDVYISGNNTFTGGFTLARANVYLGSDTALGTGTVRGSGQKQQEGFNFLSTDDARVISNNLVITENVAFRGDHSLEWSGLVTQTNVRSINNEIAEGKQLTFSGPHYAFTENDGEFQRGMHYEGSGRTVLTAGFHDRYDTADVESDGDPIGPVPPGESGPGNLIKSGSGTMVVGGASTYTGDTHIRGGNLHFVDNAALGLDPAPGGTNSVVSWGGAIGVDSGVIGNADFLNLFSTDVNSSDPYLADDGGLMLGVGEYNQNISFAPGGNLDKAGLMSLAAHEDGNVFTGAITPRDNLYRLGGGVGTLTLPNANQLTGANSLLAINGGEVALTNTNDYSGGTEIQHTTVTVEDLANGGAASGIGSSSSDEANLFIQSGTLKYAGSGDSTDRLFTIGTRGATIESSGSGAVEFTSSAALGVDIAEERTADVNSGAFPTSFNDEVVNLTNVDDLVPGMLFFTDGTDVFGQPLIPAEGVTIRSVSRRSGPIDNDHDDPAYKNQIRLNHVLSPVAFADGATVRFGPAPERKLTLAGDNSGDNTLTPLVDDASDGGLVGIRKTGSGRWVLEGDNTYTGSTEVQGGVLVVNGDQTGGGMTTVADGGRIAGDGSLGGGLTLEEGGGFLVELLGATADVLDVAGDLDLSAIGDSLDVSLLGAVSGSSWVIASYDGVLSGVFDAVTPGYTVDYGTGSNSVITLTSTGAPVLLGDYNGNGIVDAADFTVWRDNLGGDNNALMGKGDETGLSAGVVDMADYDLWVSQFGQMLPSLATSVPEPSALLLIGFSIAAASWASRRRD
ncbi:Autotransporter-associated beta strand repeat protein [Pseudobythopirellula maris]|uniref:Autotransporter-associated beta strand repeat protein n=1 Tax=Pseudobythopirellula maris TaxID=2527991 RepID=A0A5C5ZHI2_9BACT|nr:autotransporter-associated beta strand repeat-containing protein [Pseudobythopirellula maris]TWT86618.1 Autotransporter-associated beta strand repeat protein [Pseudobythopirellula maris]